MGSINVIIKTQSQTTLWNPEAQNPGITLSNGGKTATCTQTDTGNTVLSTGIRTSGKAYFEIDFTGPGGTYQYSLGICDSDLFTENDRAGFGESWAMYPRTSGSLRFYHDGSYNATVVTHDFKDCVFRFAVDLGNGKVWMGVDNTWYDADPASGTNPVFDDASIIGKNITPVFSGRNDGDIATLNTITNSFTYSPPSGFVSWG